MSYSKEVNAIINRLDLFRQVSAAAKAALSEAGAIVDAKKGDILFREREETESIYVMADGFVVLYRMTHAHDNRAIFVCASGELLNEEIVDDPVASVSGRVLSKEAKLLAVERSTFLRLMKADSRLQDAVFSAMAKKLRRTYHQLGNLSGSIHLDRQIAAKLYKLGRDFGVEDPVRGGVRIGFPLSIAFLAELVGSKRETVSRVVKALSRQGLIAAGKDGFWLADLKRLRAYVHQGKEI